MKRETDAFEAAEQSRLDEIQKLDSLTSSLQMLIELANTCFKDKEVSVGITHMETAQLWLEKKRRNLAATSYKR